MKKRRKSFKKVFLYALIYIMAFVAVISAFWSNGTSCVPAIICVVAIACISCALYLIEAVTVSEEEKK